MIIDREVERDASTKFILAKPGAANDTETAMHLQDEYSRQALQLV
jgi:hypothetical protein